MLDAGASRQEIASRPGLPLKDVRRATARKDPAPDQDTTSAGAGDAEPGTHEKQAA